MLFYIRIFQLIRQEEMRLLDANPDAGIYYHNRVARKIFEDLVYLWVGGKKQNVSSNNLEVWLKIMGKINVTNYEEDAPLFYFRFLRIDIRSKFLTSGTATSSN